MAPAISISLVLTRANHREVFREERVGYTDLFSSIGHYTIVLLAEPHAPSCMQEASWLCRTARYLAELDEGRGYFPRGSPRCHSRRCVRFLNEVLYLSRNQGQKTHLTRTFDNPGMASPEVEKKRQSRLATDTPEWAEWSDDKLLDLRVCDLRLRIEGSFFVEHIEALNRELKSRRLRFRPYFWLSDEWFTPDGVPGIALPFYLAHPRLAKLEMNQMLEVEGGTTEWCMRILRHEAGHAIENAYLLRRRRRRQRLFGKSSQPYPEYYTPKPYSRSFVRHLDVWYAQSHPDEDFAETFAVWLDPQSLWRQRYSGWPALRKLEYVDALMAELSQRPPEVITRRTHERIDRLRKTLRAHYRQRRQFYGVDHPTFYDRDLRRLFVNAGPEETADAADWLASVRREARRRVARWTGSYQYTIDQVLGDMIRRCRELRLRLSRPPDETRLEFLVLLTVQTMNYLASGRHRVAL